MATKEKVEAERLKQQDEDVKRALDQTGRKALKPAEAREEPRRARKLSHFKSRYKHLARSGMDSHGRRSKMRAQLTRWKRATPLQLRARRRRAECV